MKEKRNIWQIYCRKINEINNSNNKIKYDKLTFYFKSDDRITNLSQRSEEKWLYKLAEQKSTTNTLKMFYKAKEKVIKLFDYVRFDMEWRVCITWSIMFCITYSRLPYIYLTKHGMNNLNYLTDRILSQTIKIILKIS